MLKRKLQWMLLAFILFIGGVMYVQSDHEWALTQRTMTEVSEGVQQGDKMTPFHLGNAEGQEVYVTGNNNENMFLIFFTSWCHVCSEQWEQLDAAKSEGLLEHVKVIPVNLTGSERSEGTVAQYIQELPISSDQVLLDRDEVVQKQYEVVGVPTILLINEEGVIEERSHGMMTLEKMRESNFFR
ncbi:TlpA family protein disulfide reductase [Bacillus shivajii]|uniref:TlpA family protein disulfide reductase n=1 Tax=Bacillus shivajii TaxID=1983719 RepID=UPI001CF92F9D|nr:TlpA disulfide reductase family protein [Bacillus shivajii]UCZ51959.1 TlpA family protein disulfide reductase [Bacillus shivajii]